MFIGYPRSGHSLIGAILNAHPEIMVSHEYDVVKYLKRGLSFPQICKGICERNRWFQQRNNTWSGYSYSIPNQFQNKTDGFDIIGDKKGGRTTKQFLIKPDLIDKTVQNIPVEIKWIHVLRNPFNIISTMTRYKDSVAYNLDLFIKYHHTFKALQSKISNQNIYTLYHEDLLIHPEKCIVELLSFLNKEASSDYIKDCTSILFKKPTNTKNNITWSIDSEKRLKDFMKTSHELTRYIDKEPLYH
jgi:hypothetical protein